MKRIGSLIVISFLFTFLAAAQQSRTADAAQKCNLETKDAPVLHGIKLGMSKEDVKKIVGSLEAQPVTAEEREIKVEKLRATDFSINDKAKNLTELKLEFFEDGLYKLSIRYDSTTGWEDVKGFAAATSAEYQIPANWKIDGNRLASLFCKGFNLYLSKDASSKITLESRFTWIVISDKITELKKKQQKTP